jgi:hypothetical protein
MPSNLIFLPSRFIRRRASRLVYGRTCSVTSLTSRLVLLCNRALYSTDMIDFEFRFEKYKLLTAYAFIIWKFIAWVPRVCDEKIVSQRRLERNFFRYYLQCSGVPRGGLGTFKPPRNSEILTKLSRIPSSVENTSVTTLDIPKV